MLGLDPLSEQFYQMVTRLKANSRAVATEAKEDTMITEVHDGIIVTRPAKKIEYISETQTKNESKARFCPRYQ